MPYDPRHVSKGGNRTTKPKDLKAKKKGQYRVVDTFDGTDCIILNTSDREKAIAKVNEYQGKQMTRCYAYDIGALPPRGSAEPQSHRAAALFCPAGIPHARAVERQTPDFPA